MERRRAWGPLENQVLGLVTSRTCTNELELMGFFKATLTGSWIWLELYTPEEIEFRVRAAVNKAIDCGMAAKDADGTLGATPLGLATASKGIGIATALELAHWVRESETRIWSDLDLMLAAAVTPDGRMLQVDLAQYGATAMFLKRLTIDGMSAEVPMNRLRNCSLLPFFPECARLRSRCSHEWIDGGVYDIEERYHTLFGQTLPPRNGGWYRRDRFHRQRAARFC